MSSSTSSHEPERLLSPWALYNLLQDSAVAKGVFDIRQSGTEAGGDGDRDGEGLFADTAVKTALHVGFLPGGEGEGENSEGTWPVGRTLSDAQQVGQERASEILSGAAVTRYLWDQDSEGNAVPAAVGDAPARNAWTQRGLFPANLVILVGSGGEEGQQYAESVAALLEVEGKVKPDRIRVLDGGVPGFVAAGYGMCCSSLLRREQAVPGLMPSEIAQGFLFLGSFENAKTIEMLEQLGITHVLNMAGELVDPFPHREDLVYKKLGIDDTSADDIAQHFDEAMRFLAHARDSDASSDCKHAINGKNRVLVHCAMGISRSSAIAIAYLMETNKWRFAAAHEFVRSRRSSIKPNPGFVEQLKQKDARLFGDSD